MIVWRLSADKCIKWIRLAQTKRKKKKYKMPYPASHFDPSAEVNVAPACLVIRRLHMLFYVYGTSRGCEHHTLDGTGFLTWLQNSNHSFYCRFYHFILHRDNFFFYEKVELTVGNSKCKSHQMKVTYCAMYNYNNLYTIHQYFVQSTQGCLVNWNIQVRISLVYQELATTYLLPRFFLLFKLCYC